MKKEALSHSVSELELGYEHLDYQQALRQLLPSGVTLPGGFETVGDIAHLNLDEAQMKYKHQIG